MFNFRKSMLSLLLTEAETVLALSGRLTTLPAQPPIGHEPHDDPQRARHSMIVRGQRRR